MRISTAQGFRIPTKKGARDEQYKAKWKTRLQMEASMKAIFELNLPETCVKCRFNVFEGGWSDDWCRLLHKCHKHAHGKIRAPDCPLKLVKSVEPELKPCPFCGCKAKIITRNENNYSVQCKGCYVRLGWRTIKKDSIADWNKRSKGTIEPTKKLINGVPVEMIIHE